MNMQKSARKQRGFTLLEILIVIGIIGGLVAGVAAYVANQQEGIKRGQVKTQVTQTLGSAITAFKADTKEFPTTEEGLGVLFEKPADTSHWRGQWRGPYLESESINDPWGKEFEYQFTEAGWKVISAGPDGQSGTDDDYTFINGKETKNEAP